MGSYKILIGAGIGIIAVIVVVVIFSFSKGVIVTQDYELFVDPLLDKQILFAIGRVTLQNTGSQPLTNVRINYGDGDIDELGTLKPGQKIIVSPPADNSMQFVIVTADDGIYVSKAYREPIKMPGMMGS